MSVELQARDIGNDRLQQRFALKERQASRVTAVKMQQVEGIKDQARAPLPIRRGLGLREAWKAIGPNSAQFAMSGEPKRVERGGGTFKGEFDRFNGSRRQRRSLSTFWDIPVPTRPA